jgi:hypothetical protein
MLSDVFAVIRKKLYFFSLLLLLIGLPLSKALVSVSEALLVLSWFIAPGLKNRIDLLCQRKSIWVFICAMFIVFVGLIYSQNISRNVFLIFNIKISLVLFPIIIGTFETLTKRELKTMLVVYSIANLLSTLVSTFIYFNFINYEIINIRRIAVFVESVRFALIIVLNILFLLYSLYYTKSRQLQILISILILWFAVFLTILQSLTGVLSLSITLLVILAVNYKRINRYFCYSFGLIALLFIGYTFLLFKKNIKEYSFVHEVNIATLDTLTANGNPYKKYEGDTVRVNGHLRNIYICVPEMRKQWAIRSAMHFDSIDHSKWQPVRVTLINYLTSKGLRKDSTGVVQLTDRDIRNIEEGYKNYKLAEVGFEARVYDLIREFDEWKKTRLPAGSITIRINAMMNAWKVTKENLCFGTGYGDINDDIQLQFQKDNKVFGKDMRQNPHNQLFTIMIGSGIIGLIIFLVTYILPGIMEQRFRSYFFLVSFCVITISFFTDDTLERMIGAVIMAFFFSIALYSIPEIKKE